MALVSPGVQVTVTDQSNYAPNAIGSVAYILLATAQDKIAPGGTSIAAGTIADNAGKVFNITSQRDLVTTFGTPTFYSTSSGAAINGDERNEYGLMAAYSLLGVSNTTYIQRADVDLGALTGTAIRPLADPTNGTYWLDTTNTNWGIYEWAADTNTFTLKTPIAINSISGLAADNFTPNTAIGNIGDYAVVTAGSISDMNATYYKRYDNTWQQVGNVGWQKAWPVVKGNGTSTISSTGAFYINGRTVNVSIGDSITQVNANVNSASITGVSSRVVSGLLYLYADSTASGNAAVVTANTAAGNLALGTIGISAGTYNRPTTSIAPYYSVPSWTSNDGTPRPSGSVWQKASATGSGLNIVIKEYDSTSTSWNTQSVPDYSDLSTATFGYDPTGGGLNTSVGSLFAQYNADLDSRLATYVWRRAYTGATVVTASTTPSYANVGASFTLRTRPDSTSASTTNYTVTISTATVQGFVNAVSAANIPYVSAGLDATTGVMTLTHSLGGDMILTDGAGTPLANVGLTAFNPTSQTGATNLWASPSGYPYLLGTNWEPLSYPSYTAASTQPYVAPADGKLWYYNTPSRADIMVSNGSAWLGYRNLTADIRGYNLSNTNPTGPILKATAPTVQDDGTPLVYGDLWLNTSELENYPVIHRWQRVSGVDQWILIDNTDNASQNGIVFADARWNTYGNANPVTDAIPSIATLQTSNYLDLDAPNPALYPRGMLLWNTRASGYNVKQYKSAYFTSAAYPNQTLPGRADTWVSVSGADTSGVPLFGRRAPRSVVVAALKSSIDSSTALREDQNNFNLIACPGYPELIPNMVNLNNDRNNTGFVIGDTPMRLAANGTDIQAWAQNSMSASSTGEDGLATTSPYVGIYYPAGQTNDLNGSAIAVPSSHAALRTIIKSDNISYPWLAPAGTLRGAVDNLSSIGYIDSTTGSFVSIGVSQGLRDVLYTNKINPLTYLPGAGLVVYGQKTLASTPSSLDRINVARLVNYLRNQLNQLARPFIFEPNDPITRKSITAIVSGLLNDLVSKRGVTDYLIVCDSTNNTADRIARNELYIDVAIQPTKDVEFIYIPIRLKNPGEIQGGNLAAATAVGTGA